MDYVADDPEESGSEDIDTNQEDDAIAEEDTVEEVSETKERFW